MKQALFAVISGAIICTSARAATQTWTGSGSDANFGTSDNWGGSIPANGDTLVFSGSAAKSPNNNLTDLSVAGLTFNNTAAFSLTGNPITILGNVTNTALASAITDAIANNLVLGAATNTFTCSSKHSLTVNGVISGSGALEAKFVDVTPTLNLYGLNTYTGPTTISTYQVNINTIANIGVPCSLGAPMTVEDATITIAAGRLAYKGSVNGATDRPIKVTVSKSTAQIYSTGKTLTLNGSIYGDTGTQNLTFRDAGNVVVNGLITNMNDVGRTDAGTLYLTNSVNYFSGSLKCNTGTIIFNTISNSGIPCAIGTGNNIQLGQNTATPPGIIAFTGPHGGSTDRKIIITSYPGATNSALTGTSGGGGGGISNAVAGQTLTFNGTIATGAGNYPPFILTGPGDGVIAQAIPSPVYVYKQDTGTWTLNGANTTTGDVSITGGTLLINGSTAAPCAITASTAGTLGGTGTVNGAASILNGGTLAPGSANQVGNLSFGSNLTLGTSAIFAPKMTANSHSTVTIAGNLNLAGNAILNPVLLGISSLPAGTYTLMTYAAKTGSGSITLPAEISGAVITLGDTALTLSVAGTLTWSGDGAANRWDLTTANWNGSLYSDSDAVLFDDTGSDSPPVSIAAAVSPLAVTVRTDTKAYTFTGAGIAGTASFTKSGAAALVISNANTYTGATTLTGGTNTLAGSLSGSSVMINIGTVFNETASGAISGETVGLTVLGTATLAGTNAYGGPTVIGDYGATNKASLAMQSPAALGNTSGISIRGYSESGTAEVDLILSAGQTYSGKTVTFSGGNYNRVGILGNSAGTTTWAGDIVCDPSAGIPNIYIQNLNIANEFILGSPEGGNIITGNCASIAFRGDMSTVRLYSQVSIGNATFTRDNRGILCIYSTNNTWGSFNFSQGRTILYADNALATNQEVSIGKANSDTTGETILDLNGHSQLIGPLNIKKGSSATPANNLRTIFSVEPATLIINSVSSSSFGDVYSSITGAVSIVKQGTGTQTLASTNTLTGFILVSGGTLAATSDKAFGACTNVTIEAAGTLSLSTSDAIDNSATLAVRSGASVVLGTDVKETVGYLIIDGESKAVGTYGASGSGADHILSCFSGTGLLTVSKGSGGSRVLLR